MNRMKVISLLLAAVMLLGLTACGSEEAAPAAPVGVAVQVEEVTRDAISTENRVSGVVSSDNEAMIMIAATAKCTATYFSAGDAVKAGDVICTLDLGSSLASYSAALIGYESASQSYYDQKAILDKQVQLAANNVANTKALFDIGAASQLEIDQAELNYQSAVAGRNSGLAQLESAMQNAKSGLEQLDMVLENVDAEGNVIAPIDGTLVTLNAVEGSFTSSTMPLASVVGEGQMKVHVSVSENLVPKLSIGDKAEVYFSALNRTVEASIRSVDRAANMQTQLYTVVLTVPADVEGLLSGMFADVTFRTDTSDNAVVVPTEAILTSNETQYVFVVEGDTACYREITTGLTGSGVTEVLSGLDGGEQLVTVGQAYLQDGDAVRVVSGEA